jgi:hypothetical protein
MVTALNSQRPTPRDSHRERFTNRRAVLLHKTPIQTSQLPVPSARNNSASRSPLAVAPIAPIQPAVHNLPTTRPLPNWLRLLIQAQRGSLAVTFVLVVVALVVYGGTVYTQQLWSKEYRKLKTMQRSERQMLAASEVLKNQIIQQAESPNSGLVAKSPQHTLVLESAPLRTVKPASMPAVIKADPSATLPPLGY